MEGSLLLTLVTLHFVALISPGPDFTLVVHHAHQYGRKMGYWIAIGLGLGIACHSLLSLTGISVLIQQHPMAPWILKTLGGAYLVYLGSKIFWALKKKNNLETPHLSTPKNLTHWQGLKRGLTANLLNPKAMLFFIGLMSSMAPTALPWSDTLLITFLLGGSGVIWFMLLSSIFGHPKAQQKLLRWQRPIDALCATALIVMGSAFLLN